MAEITLRMPIPTAVAVEARDSGGTHMSHEANSPLPASANVDRRDL